jgi:murein DD-endopeptidase MepM/ murein hydrolase activator NlpD
MTTSLRSFVLGLSVTALAVGGMFLATVADASARGVHVTARPATVAAGGTVKVTVRGTSRRCALSLRVDRRGSHVTYQHSVRRTLKIIVPFEAAAGRRVVRIRCGGRAASARFTVAASAKAPAPSSTGPVTDGATEHYNFGDGLPDGIGDPSQYAVAGGSNQGGAGFSTYWPLPTGMRVTITESPGGSYSHNTVYTRDAVDLGISRGTEIRAGFTGVVARISNGCGEGNYSCGSGYGNYIYLKASDGTCAITAHLSQINVSLGQQVPQYTLLGLSGNTGNSTGPHLHFGRVDCSNNRSMPWAPVEGGSLAEGTSVVSQNAPAPSGAPQPAPAPAPAPTPTPGPAPAPTPPPTYAETTGGNTNTWTNYTNAGGTQGPTIPSNATVQIACKLAGFRVADGNTWWYRIAQSPWNGQFYASADAFYNNGQTSGSLHGTPFVDNNVPNC